ncbi:hypothetical protein KAS79_03560 [Candidatus Parcubacteria bacterium]|nr:hypothetical protein [Candidatus Parcubacteria bacterium]
MGKIELLWMGLGFLAIIAIIVIICRYFKKAKIKCECGGELIFLNRRYYQCDKCGIVKINFEVIPQGKQNIPIEESWACKYNFLLNHRISKILGKVRSIYVNSSLYASPGETYHWDILAENQEDVNRIIQQNWEKLKKVMRLFGEELIGWEMRHTPRIDK